MKPKEFEIGLSNYRQMVLSNKYIVDKSLFIKEFLHSQKQVMLIPRPRRFGKTFNISMLEAFFNCATNDNAQLFEGTKIAKETELMSNFCGKYPIISLSFKDVNADNWQSMQNKLKIFFKKTFIRFKYLLKSDKVDEDDKESFIEILKGRGNIDDLGYSLELLMKMLHDFYGKRIIVLIDEYDAPIHSSYLNQEDDDKFYKRTVSFMRDFLSGAFKDNDTLFKACITGILRVSKESIFSGLNNVAVFSILDDYFASSFGLTQDEVKNLCDRLNLQNNLEGIKHWYNGYSIGGEESIYNPWSVLNYISMPQLGFKAYWNNSSNNRLPQSLISVSNAEKLRESFVTLIQGGTITSKIHEDFVFPDLDNDEELFWSLMLFSGYLTLKEQMKDKYTLRIPNNEVRKIFIKILDNWLKIKLKANDYKLTSIANSLINRDLKLFERLLNDTMVATLSYFDLEAANEKIYHVYLIALLSVLRPDYLVKSNRESGDGRFDILLLPKKPDLTGVVLELKAISPQKNNEDNEKFEKRIAESQKQALMQIKNKRYFSEFEENNVAKDKIFACAVIFSGKKAYVGS